MKRTRSKTIKANASLSHIAYWEANGTYRRKDVYATTYTALESTITDITGNPQGDNPCDHLTIERDRAAGVLLPKAFHKPQQVYVEIQTNSLEVKMPQGTWAQNRPEINWTAVMEELERNASGDMSTSVNMVVNIAEAVELKSLAKQVIASFKVLTRRWLVYDRRVRAQLKGRARRGKRAALPSLKELASGHLGYSFGAAPLIQDISAFLDINQKIRERRKELAERSLKPTRISARTTAVLEYAEGGFGATLKPSNWTKVQIETDHWLKGTGVVSAVCSAFYNLDNPSTRWKHVSQALGLTSPLTSIWNLIPFSFVADWFIPIGKAIKRVERAGWDLVDEAAVTKAYTLTNYLYSTKVQCVSVASTRAVGAVAPLWEGRKLGTQAQRWTHYTREVGRPLADEWAVDPSSDWSVSRTALSTSLALQRIGKTPKPLPKKWPTLDQIYTKARAARR